MLLSADLRSTIQEFEPSLNWRQRPMDIKLKVNAAFTALTKQLHSSWGLYNGRPFYLPGIIDDCLIIEKLLLQGIDRGQTEFIFVDIGAGNFSWGRAIAGFINDHPIIFKKIKKVDIFSLRGEKNLDKPIIERGVCILYEYGSFAIENLIDEFIDKKMDLTNKVDLIISSWCFRHLVDPVGTLMQSYELLKATTGLLIIDSFNFTDNYQFHLMSDLPSTGIPEISNIYFAKKDTERGNKLEYTTIDPTGKQVRGELDISVEGELTRDFLIYFKQQEILTITTERGHTFNPYITCYQNIIKLLLSFNTPFVIQQNDSPYHEQLNYFIMLKAATSPQIALTYQPLVNNPEKDPYYRCSNINTRFDAQATWSPEPPKLITEKTIAGIRYVTFSAASDTLLSWLDAISCDVAAKKELITQVIEGHAIEKNKKLVWQTLMELIRYTKDASCIDSIISDLLRENDECAREIINYIDPNGKTLLANVYLTLLFCEVNCYYGGTDEELLSRLITLATPKVLNANNLLLGTTLLHELVDKLKIRMTIFDLLLSLEFIDIVKTDSRGLSALDLVNQKSAKIKNEIMILEQEIKEKTVQVPISKDDQSYITECREEINRWKVRLTEAEQVKQKLEMRLKQSKIIECRQRAYWQAFSKSSLLPMFKMELSLWEHYEETRQQQEAIANNKSLPSLSFTHIGAITMWM